VQINPLEFLGEYVHGVGDAILDAHKISLELSSTHADECCVKPIFG
jgi:hypothetical protein